MDQIAVIVFSISYPFTFNSDHNYASNCQPLQFFWKRSLPCQSAGVDIKLKVWGGIYCMTVRSNI